MRIALSAGISVLAAACASQLDSPNADAARSAVQAAAFRHQGSDAGSFDPNWWAAFNDPSLIALVREAQQANLDVRIAATRVLQARAGSTAAASRLAPTLGLNGSASDQRSGLPDAYKRTSPDTRALRASLDLGWEIDVFGAARASADAATLDADASMEAAEGARLLASSEVARLYIGWQGSRLRLQQIEAMLQTQSDTERLTRSREAQGLSSRFDVARAAAETQTLAAQLPSLRTLVATTGHQISLLLGRSATQPLPMLDEHVAPQLPDVPALPPGQPAELLARRPDLRAAERQLAAEGARLREARADLLPRFFIAALFGGQDLTINRQALSPVRYSNVALAFSMPLFNAGRLHAAEDRASARERGAALHYERAVLGAVQEVEDSLVVIAQERERAHSLDALRAQRRTALHHAESLRREGQIDLLQLLDAQRGVISAELAWTEHRTQLVLDAVQLYKALGGGWRLPVAKDAAVAAGTPISASSR
ncbi:MAG: efflux transporter outer membrane subunit [Burkholderiaceae bacterium]|nr:efflux transporter outer membrane subunit [Burkholderiaceae bacterium]